MANDQAWQIEIDGDGKSNDDRSLRRRIRLADAVWWQQSRFDGERITSSAIRVLPRTGISNAPSPDRQAFQNWREFQQRSSAQPRAPLLPLAALCNKALLTGG
jgi:hypothetical protein